MNIKINKKALLKEIEKNKGVFRENQEPESIEIEFSISVVSGYTYCRLDRLKESGILEEDYISIQLNELKDDEEIQNESTGQ